MSAKSEVFILVLLCISITIASIHLGISLTGRPSSNRGVAQENLPQDKQSKVTDEKWWEKEEILKMFREYELGTTFASALDIQKWISLAQENGDLYAISEFEMISKTATEASVVGEPILVFDPDNEEHLISVVTVDRRVRPILFDSPQAEYNLYLYNRLLEQKIQAKDYLEKGTAEQAIKTFIDWLGTGPDFAVSHFYLGDIYLKSATTKLSEGAELEEELKKAIQHYEIGYPYNSNNTRALYNLGYANLLSGNLEEAQNKFETYVDKQPTDPDGHFALLKLYEQLGNMEAVEKQRHLINKLDANYLAKAKEPMPKQFWFEK